MKRKHVVEVLALFIATVAAVFAFHANSIANHANDLAAQANDLSKQSNGVADKSLTVAKESLKETQAESYRSERSEIEAAATEMADLDLARARRNGDRILLLGSKADALIKQDGQGNLHLSGEVYRILAQYLVLDTDKLLVAKNFAEAAVRIDTRDGPSGTLELIRAHRVLAEIAAQDGDVTRMRHEYSVALSLARAYNNPTGRVAVKSSTQRTHAFAVFAALLAAERGGGSEGCDAAQEYIRRAANDHLSELFASHNLEVARRAYRVSGSSECDTSGSQLTGWKGIWRNR